MQPETQQVAGRVKLTGHHKDFFGGVAGGAQEDSEQRTDLI